MMILQPTLRCLVFAGTLALGLRLGAAAAPVLSFTLPQAATPGGAVEVTLRGQHFANLSRIWTSFPARFEILPLADGEDASAMAKIRLTLPRDLQVGIGAMRIVTPEGVSKPKLIMLDDLPSITDEGSNLSRDTAQPLTLPIAVDGASVALQSRFYSFEAKAGQRLAVEVVAQRLASQLESVVRLLDANGKELIYADDDSGSGADARFAHEFEADGQFVLELRDLRHQGGDGYFYRLRLGDFPLATSAYPLGGRAGTVSSFAVNGPSVGELGETHILLPHSPATRLALGVRNGDRIGSGFVTVAIGRHAEVLELEPNDVVEAATPAELPCVVNGRLEKPQDQDCFRFQGRQGQRWIWRGLTRSLGSPADLLVRLVNADGNTVVEVDDTGKDEGSLDYTFPDDKTYTLVVQNLVHSGGPAHTYRIEVEPFQDWFTLATDQSTYNLPRGGTASIKVTSQRRGYAGPIELRLDGVEDAQLQNSTIPQDKNETTLKVTVPDQLEPGTLQFTQIVGKATIDEQEYSVAASTRDGLRGELPRAFYPPASMYPEIALGVGPVFPPFFELSVTDGRAYFPRQVGNSDTQINVNRVNGEFKAKVDLAIDGLPEGFEATVEPIAEGKNESVIKIKGPADTAAADHQFRITGTATFLDQTKQVVMEQVPLKVTDPLVVFLNAEGPLQPGGQQQVKVRVKRFGQEPHPVTIRWVGGPAEILLPFQVVIPADQTELLLPIAASAAAAAGQTEPLLARATTRFGDGDLTIDCDPLQLTVEAKKE